MADRIAISLAAGLIVIIVVWPAWVVAQVLDEHVPFLTLILPLALLATVVSFLVDMLWRREE